MTEEAAPHLIELTQAPEIYADEAAWVSTENGVAKFVFVSNAYVSHGHVQKRVVLRLAVPLTGVISLHNGAGSLIQKLEENGILTTEARPN